MSNPDNERKTADSEPAKGDAERDANEQVQEDAAEEREHNRGYQ